MRDRALGKTIIVATILQGIVVLLGRVVPGFQENNVYPVAGTLVALLAGFLYARAGRANPLLRVLGGGAIAAGVSSFLGIVGASLTGQGGPEPVTTVGVATATGIVAGFVGAFAGRAVTGRGPPPGAGG